MDDKSRLIKTDTCLLRADAPGFRLVARQTGIMSHVCISMPCADLAERFPNGPPEMLDDVLPFGSRLEGIWQIHPTPALAEAALTLLGNGLRDAFEWSRCEPVAMQFLLEALAALTPPENMGDDPASAQFEQAEALYEALVDDPELDLVDVLGPGLSSRQQREVLRMFETRYGLSLRNFRHRLIMDRARAALTDGTLIKQLAYDLGYSHVANFTRAYRRAFGESPSQTLRRQLRQSQARSRI
jgi:hypothetical protein